jgi:hypothetical protein
VAGIKDFKKVSSANEDTSKLQERLQEFFQPLVTNPLLDGVLITGVDVGTTATQIKHNLRREPIGYVIVGLNANATVWEASRDLYSAFLTLQASSPVKVSLWVF